MEGNTTWDRLRWARDEVISTDGAAANQGDTTWDRLGWAHDEVISADGAAARMEGDTTWDGRRLGL